MTQSRPPFDDALDAAFQQARETPPPVPESLMDRVVADAIAAMPQADRTPFWKQLLGMLGGWPAMAGLAMTACVGIWAGGVLSDDLISTFGISESAAFETGSDLGAFDLLLVDG
jgi:hypothetical protein